jgi:hypothetical protein
MLYSALSFVFLWETTCLSKSGASNRRKGPIKHLNYMKSSSHHNVAACIIIQKNFVFNSMWD